MHPFWLYEIGANLLLQPPIYGWAEAVKDFGLLGIVLMAIGVFAWKWLLPFVKEQIDKERQARETDYERAQAQRERDLREFREALTELKGGMGSIADSMKSVADELRGFRKEGR